MKLDRTAVFGIVSGEHGGAVAYQAGHYFDGDDNYLFSDPGKSPPPGVKAKAGPRQAEPEAAGQPEGAATETGAPAPDVTLAAGITRDQLLQQLNTTQLKQLVVDAGGTPEIGSGAKKKMITWLLDNTV
jgi:hypothetical protein